MTRIPDCFSRLTEGHRKGLIPYLVAGDPGQQLTSRLMHCMVDSGADIIELGVPFSDPMVDGKVIQGGHERALAQGVRLQEVFAMVADFRADDVRTPVVLMSYLNPVLVMGYERFAERAAEVGVDGVILVDLPPEADEVEVCCAPLAQRGVAQIFLLAPNTANARVPLIVNRCSGYVYYVSLQGVTGSKALDIAGVARHLQRIRQWINMPLAVGFGVQSGHHAAELARLCDAVVIGSAVVQRIAEHQQDEQALFASLREFLGDIRRALDTRDLAA